MFLRSSNSGGRTSWTVVESYREGRWATHRTIYKLGTHATREAAQAMWDALVKLDEILAESKIGRGGAAAREELSRKVARALRRASGGGVAIDEKWLRARVAEAVAGGPSRRPRATPRVWGRHFISLSAFPPGPQRPEPQLLRGHPPPQLIAVPHKFV